MFSIMRFGKKLSDFRVTSTITRIETIICGLVAVYEVMILELLPL